MLGAVVSTDAPPGRSFVYWLSQACKNARVHAGLSQADIPTKQSRVARFELRGRWPEDPEDLVAAYADALGIGDSRELWRLALEMWLEYGQAPTRVAIDPPIPGIPEGELLRLLRDVPPTGPGRAPRTTRAADPEDDAE